MTESEKYIQVYTCCQFIKGISRSLIFDTQRREYFLVPNSLYDFIKLAEGNSMSGFLSTLDDSDKKTADEYLQFLIVNDIVFFGDSMEELMCFPPMDLEWHTPFKISNAIVELKNKEFVPDINKCLKDTYIKCIQFIFLFTINDIDELKHSISLLQDVPCRTKQILFKNSGRIGAQELIDLCCQDPAIEIITAFESITDQIEKINNSIVILSRQRDFTAFHCGVVHAEYFNLQLEHYTESLAHNTCLNRKVSIDVEGNIKNCPSMKESFGNIRDTSLTEALNKPEFKKYWNITKAEISVCKDCEFRHICTDCRAYLENPEDMYSKPLKCGYDPYTCTWEEWSTHPLKQQSIAYYGMEGLK